MGLLTVFFVGPALVPLVVPMSRYYELRTVTVSDTTVDASPRVIVDRSIERDFRGRFEVEVLRAEGGQFVVWWECGPHSSDWRTYRPEAVLPSDMDLDWWMGIPPNRPCPLPPGTYKIFTTIYAKGPLGAELSVSRSSNAFVVNPADPAAQPRKDTP